MAKRQSMRGMGTDAFFNTPPAATPAEPSGANVVLPASQHASKSASTDELVKATFYLTPGQIMKLEQLRLTRRQQGHKVDKSALVREAIDALAD